MHAVASKSIDFQPKIPARIRDGTKEVKKKIDDNENNRVNNN